MTTKTKQKQSCVYLITSGVYSDYQVHCAFTDKKLAEEWLKRAEIIGTPVMDYRIEVRTLYDTLPEPLILYSVNIVYYPQLDYGDKIGWNVLKTKRPIWAWSENFNKSGKPISTEDRRIPSIAKNLYNNKYNLSTHIWATGIDEAKVDSRIEEIRQKLIAAGIEVW